MPIMYEKTFTFLTKMLSKLLYFHGTFNFFFINDNKQDSN